MSSHADISNETDRQQPKGLRDVWYSNGGKRVRKVMSAVVYRLYRLLGEVTAVVLGLGILISWFLASTLDRQSTDLTVFRPNIKTWVSDAFDGRGAEFGRLDLVWLPATDQVVLTVEDASVLDDNGDVLESFDLIRATLERRKGTRYTPQLVNAQIKGGIVSYVEDEEGAITVGLGPPDAVGRVGPVYQNSKQTENSTNIPLQSIDFIQVQDAKLFVRNAVSGIDLTANVDLVNVSVSDDGGFVLSAEGDVIQPDKSAPFKLEAISEGTLNRVKVRLDIKDARPDEIAPTKGRFWELQGLAAPVNLAANVDFSKADGLQSSGVNLSIGKGTFTVLRNETDMVFPIDRLRAVGTLEAGAERMEIRQFGLKSPKVSFESSGFLTELGNLSDGDPNSSPVFDLKFNDVQTDMTPRFEAPLVLETVKLRGQADMDSRVLSIAEGSLSYFGSTHDFDGELAFKDNNRPDRLDLNTRMSGVLTPSQFLSVWPVDAIGGARRWLNRSILSGDITVFEGSLNLDPQFFEDRLLTEDRIRFRFAGENAVVKYMETLPPAHDLVGSGVIIGNKLEANLESGRLETITLSSGQVEIPQLIPRGGDLIVTVQGNGSVVDLLTVADNEPFMFATRYGVDPNTLAGQGDINLRVTRPLLEFFPRDRITYQVNGDFTGAKAPFSFGRHDIQNGNVKLDANRDRMILSGPVDVGPWRADMEWLETFGENPPPTRYKVSGDITAEELDRLGIASRGWFDGTAAVLIEAEGHGMNVETAALDIDLTNTTLSVERVWMKPAGEEARLVGQVIRNENDLLVENAHLTGEGISVQGQVSLESDYKLKALNLPEVRIDGLIESDVQVKPNHDRSRLDVSVDGRWLDVSPWTQDLFATRESGFDIPLNLSGNIETLVLDPDYSVDGASFFFSHSGDVIQGARLEAMSDEKPLFMEVSTASDLKRQLDVRIPDASKAVSAFLGLSNTSGGALSLNASLPPAGEVGPFIGEVEMRDFRLNEAPALAQLLSLASLTGLADTLSSGSMKFDRFKMPFTMLEDDISIRDARLYGPALGMTGDGDIDLDLRVLDFDGTLVPAYTANSILGDIPILGDIFVQEKDGGLFALTYTVSGPFEQTQIAINPLSALTPGFLRGIFKRDRSEVDEELKRKIEEVAPVITPDAEPEP